MSFECTLQNKMHPAKNSLFIMDSQWKVEDKMIRYSLQFILSERQNLERL